MSLKLHDEANRGDKSQYSFKWYPLNISDDNKTMCFILNFTDPLKISPYLQKDKFKIKFR